MFGRLATRKSLWKERYVEGSLKMGIDFLDISVACKNLPNIIYYRGCS